MTITPPPTGRRFGSAIAKGMSRIADLALDFGNLIDLLTLVAGIGILGYVAVSWLIHLVAHAQYLAASAVGLLGLLLVAAAFTRIPATLIVLIGGAAVCGTAFLAGHGAVLLP